MKLQHAVSQKKIDVVKEKEAISHAANILGRTFEKVLIYMMLLDQMPLRIVLHVIFWLGKLAIETIDNHKRTITFSPI
jgi:hypothetical protein